MIVPARNLPTMAYKNHVCVMAIGQSSKKRLVKTRKMSKNRFICGSCNITFDTICRLHEHCTQHSEGGSYFFNNVSFTAFPKYNTACAFTQVTDEIIDLEIHRNASEILIQADEENCIVDGLNVVNKRETPVRKSKSQAKLNRIWITQKKNQSQHSISDSKDEGQNESYQNKSIESMIQSTSKGQSITCNLDQEEVLNEDNQCETHISDTRLKDDLQDKLDTDVVPVLHSKPINRKSSRHTKVDPDFRKVTSDKVGDAHETDEMTASEVLIAISKGISTEENEIPEVTIDDAGKPERKDERTSNKLIIKHEEIEITNETVENQPPSKLEEDKSSNVELVKGKTDKKKTRGRKQKHIDKSVSSDAKQTCPICGKVGGQALMYYHKFMHLEKKDFTCETCGASFKHPRCLQVHQKQHTEKQFRCSMCSAAFHRREYLKTHLLKHSGEEPYMCDICGKSYREKNNLSRHIRHVHEKVRNYECDVCKERFFRSDHLQNHRLRHTEPNKKCPYCPRLFKHPDDLLRHTKTHTGEKKWHCHLCGHGFVSVSPYYVHMLKKHEIKREEAKLLKDKLQAEHKLRMSGKSGTNVKDVAIQSTNVSIKSESLRGSSSEIQPSDDQPVLTDGIYTDMDMIPVSNHVTHHVIQDMTHHVTPHTGTRHVFEDGTPGPVDMESDVTVQSDNQTSSRHVFEDSTHAAVSIESVDTIQSNNQTSTHVTQYLLDYGDQDMTGNQSVILEEGASLEHFTGNQTVILEEGASLDHLEIEIDDVGDAIQFRNFDPGASGVQLSNIEGVQLRTFEEGSGGVQMMSNMELEEGNIQAVVFVDSCSEQIAEEVVIQNQ